jgi:hypothetical protein
VGALASRKPQQTGAETAVGPLVLEIHVKESTKVTLPN